jgi:hypothetical protein
MRIKISVRMLVVSGGLKDRVARGHVLHHTEAGDRQNRDREPQVDDPPDGECPVLYSSIVDMMTANPMFLPVLLLLAQSPQEARVAELPRRER